jgi:type IV pilus assembly protein PilW
MLELMVALSLGLLLMVGIGTIFVGSNQTNRVQGDNARIQEVGRYALEIIGRSLRQAGASAQMSTNPAAVTVTCVAPACTAITGTDDSLNGTASDTLTVQMYAHADEVNGGVWGTRDCTGGFANAGTLVTHAFALNGTDLRCTGSVGGVQPLLSNIEDLQVIYGIDNNGDQSAEQYTVTPANWNRVVTARVCVLVRSESQGISVGRQTYLNCAGALGTATGAAASTQAAVGDSRLHRAFVATFSLRNRISRIP